MGALLCPHHSPAVASPATGPSERPAAATPHPAPARARTLRPRQPPKTAASTGKRSLGGVERQAVMVWAAHGSRNHTSPLTSAQVCLRAGAEPAEGRPRRPALRPCLAADPGAAPGSSQCSGRRLFTRGFEVKREDRTGGSPGGFLTILPRGRRSRPNLFWTPLGGRCRAELCLQLLQSPRHHGAIPTNTS